MCFVLYIDDLSVSMGFSVRFGIYEQKYVLRCFSKIVFGNGGDAKLDLFIPKLPLRPWDLSHRVERQK